MRGMQFVFALALHLGFIWYYYWKVSRTLNFILIMNDTNIFLSSESLRQLCFLQEIKTEMNILKRVCLSK